MNYGLNTVPSVSKSATTMGTDKSDRPVSVSNGLEGNRGFICCFLPFSMKQMSEDSVKLSPYCHGYSPSSVIYFSLG